MKYIWVPDFLGAFIAAVFAVIFQEEVMFIMSAIFLVTGTICNHMSERERGHMRVQQYEECIERLACAYENLAVERGHHEEIGWADR